MKRIVNGEEVELQTLSDVEITPLQDRLAVRGPQGVHSALAARVGGAIHVSYRGMVFAVEQGSARRVQTATSSGEIRASMPGQIVDVFAKEGQSVVAGEKLVVLEAMKTQQAYTAPFDGVVGSVDAQKGMQVADGELLLIVTPSFPPAQAANRAPQEPGTVS